VLAGGDSAALAELLGDLADRGAFADSGRLERLLGTFGGERVVHGHTPIWYVDGVAPTEVTAPLVYAHGRALRRFRPARHRSVGA
jgi:hypothetical protein